MLGMLNFDPFRVLPAWLLRGSKFGLRNRTYFLYSPRLQPQVYEKKKTYIWLLNSFNKEEEYFNLPLHFLFQKETSVREKRDFRPPLHSFTSGSSSSSKREIIAAAAASGQAGTCHVQSPFEVWQLKQQQAALEREKKLLLLPKGEKTWRVFPSLSSVCIYGGQYLAKSDRFGV